MEGRKNPFGIPMMPLPKVPSSVRNEMERTIHENRLTAQKDESVQSELGGNASAHEQNDLEKVDSMYESLDFNLIAEIDWDSFDASEEGAPSIAPISSEQQEAINISSSSESQLTQCSLQINSPQINNYCQIQNRTNSFKLANTSILGNRQFDDIRMIDGEYETDSDEDDDYRLAKAKTARFGSIGRILEDTIGAVQERSMENLLRSASVSKDDFEASNSLRKEIIELFWKNLTLGNRQALVIFVRDHCSDAVEFIYPDIRVELCGKADVMTVFSLIFEAYPDAMWDLHETLVNENNIVIKYKFCGTNIFNLPMHSLFIPTREKVKKFDESKVSTEELMIDANIVVSPPSSLNVTPTNVNKPIKPTEETVASSTFSDPSNSETVVNHNRIMTFYFNMECDEVAIIDKIIIADV